MSTTTTRPGQDPIRVRPGLTGEIDNLTALLDEAFRQDPVSRWMFANVSREGHDWAAHAAMLRVFTDWAVYCGHAQVAVSVPSGTPAADVEDQAHAVALWVPAGPSFPHSVPPRERQRPDFTNLQGWPRLKFDQFAELSRTAHPMQVDHQYLPFVAVAPPWQGHGVGTRLLRHRLDQLDAERVPAYLEASNPDSARLYKRLGFRPIGEIRLPAGPPLTPMWRDPTGFPVIRVPAAPAAAP